MKRSCAAKSHNVQLLALAFSLNVNKVSKNRIEKVQLRCALNANLCMDIG